MDTATERPPPAVEEPVEGHCEALDAHPHGGGGQGAEKEFLASALDTCSVWCGQGRYTEARRLLDRTVLIHPDCPELLAALGAAWAGEGHREQAIHLYRKAIDLRPAFAEAHANLGALLDDTGSSDKAIHHIQLALALKPDLATAWCNLANILARQGRTEHAITHYRRALELEPDLVPASSNLGLTLLETARVQEAGEVFDRLVHDSTGRTVDWSHWAAAWQGMGRGDRAIEALERAVQRPQDGPETYLRLVDAYRRSGMLEQAAQICKHVLEHYHECVPAHVQLGELLALNHRIEQALDLFRQALAIDPDNPIIHFRIGYLLLLTGQYEQGWSEYRWRRRCDFPSTRPVHPMKGPEWQGQTLDGKRLFVYCEQGLGDVLHFVRYLPLLKSCGATILFEAQAPLRRLLSPAPWIDELLTVDPHTPAPVRYDYCASVMDLAGILGTTTKTIPSVIPYIRADADRVRQWRSAIAGPGPSIGLVWAGNPRHPDDANRSCRLDDFACLGQAPGVRLFSLQKGNAALQLQGREADPPITDLGPHLCDFADTAAVMDCLDLIISVDTAPAHLAAAMGRPTWVVLPNFPDWRWMLDRTDSPWYPTMRLFRQPRPGDWGSVLAEVTEQLGMLGKER